MEECKNGQKCNYCDCACRFSIADSSAGNTA